MAFYENGFMIVQDGLSYEQFTVSTTVVGLPSIPDYTPVRRCLIQVLGGDIRWIASKTDMPTDEFGIYMTDGDFFVYDGDPEDFHVVMDVASATEPTLGVHYFGSGR